MSREPDPRAPLTSSQQEGLEARTVDQDRTLAAMHQLEAALGAAAPGRETRWRDDVLGALRALDGATAEEAVNADGLDSLLSDIARTQPRLRTRVRGVRAQYRALRSTIALLVRDLEERDDSVPDFADLRQRLAWLLTALRHQRARESDLIYEAYYDAFDVDIR